MTRCPTTSTGDLSATASSAATAGRRDARDPDAAPTSRSGPGQSVALVAPSGAGKSTLLHIAGLLEQPDAGEVYVDGTPTSRPRRRRAHAHAPHRDRLRLPVPPSAAGIHRARERHAAADDPRPVARREARQRAPRAARLSRPRRARSTIGRPNSPAASSSASRSRARSPTRRASCSPTSRPAISIRKTAEHVFSALTQLVRASGLAALIATHNMDLAARMDRRVTLRDGKVVEVE